MRNVLISQTGKMFKYTTAGLAAALDLAPAHGWQPMGTVAPSVDDAFVDEPRIVQWTDHFVEALLNGTTIFRDGTPTWDGDYWRADGQSVCTADARSLAAALRAAVGALRKRHAELVPTVGEDAIIESRRFAVNVTSDGAVAAEERTEVEEYHSLLDHYVGDDNARYLEKLAAFCELGAFRIY